MSQMGTGHPDDPRGRAEPPRHPHLPRWQDPQGGTLTGETISVGPLTLRAEEPPYAWIIRPEDLDRLPRLTQTPPEDAASPPSDPLAAYRPDQGGAWPEDRLTLSYGELRRLVALHLETCARSMPRHAPWDFMAMRATAMRDGEVPLLVSEVLDS